MTVGAGRAGKNRDWPCMACLRHGVSYSEELLLDGAVLPEPRVPFGSQVFNFAWVRRNHVGQAAVSLSIPATTDDKAKYPVFMVAEPGFVT